jgi:exopolysaccharide biosynthesis protein
MKIRILKAIGGKLAFAGVLLALSSVFAEDVRTSRTIVFVVVDGRQPKISVGFSIDELAALMAKLGCVEAINLDGGGSSTMVAGGRVVNSPSDAAGERPVSDALLIFKK